MRHLLPLVALLFSPAAVAAFDAQKAFDELGRIRQTLSKAQMQQLGQGVPVIVTRPRPGSGIPNAFIFKVVDAHPEEIAAIMADYERHKSYFENGKMRESKIIHRYSPLDVLVAYEIQVIPIFHNENYVLRSRLSRYGENGYRMDRALVEGETVKEVEGVARAEPYDGRRSLVMYFGFVDPGISISEKKAVGKIQSIVTSLEKQVLHEKRSEPVLLERQIRDLREAFASAR